MIADCKDSILQTYTRAIVHMRQQLQAGRFGLVLGSGVSRMFQIPTWPELLDRIAKHKDVGASAVMPSTASQTSRSQLLFQHYRSQQAAKTSAEEHSRNRFDMRIRSSWRRIIHDCLYQDLPEGIDELITRDKYLDTFLPIIRRAKVTVNYNFDDCVERMLANARTVEERKTERGYETLWNPALQAQTRNAVVYHPNGFLPRNLLERPSDDLVFLEDTFADQLIDSMAGHYSALLTHLYQNTCLFIGLSLKDSTLRHLLRQNARMNPGHVHYYIAFVPDGKTISEEQQKAVADSNFSVYNLVTIFARTEGIKSIGMLLSREQDSFHELAQELGVKCAHVFYLTGPVGAGKSTVVSNFKSLTTHDEWLEERPPEMAKHPDSADPDTIAQIDEWVCTQFGLKNTQLLRYREGIHIIDRTPLDPLAFTKPEEWTAKAKLLRNKISPGRADRQIRNGKVIFLKADKDVLSVRAIARHKEGKPERLQEQSDRLDVVYPHDEAGVRVIDTREMGIVAVVRRVAEIVHREPYSECNMEQRLCDVADGRVAPKEVKDEK